MSQSHIALSKSIRSKRRLVERWLVQQIFEVIGPAPFRVLFKNREAISPPGISPLATVSVRDYRTLAQVIVDPEIGFGEAYADGRIQVEGDLVPFLEGVYRSMASTRPGSTWYQRLNSYWIGRSQANTLRGSYANVHRHYDLGNEFYKLWLDPQLIYTCAYFPSPSATLEDAQQAKLDYVCRKLQLQPGARVIEAGCGWGALALHMARRYGASVKAFNISREQIQYARRRAAEEGLSNKVEFIEDDCRNISGKYDAFVSVGMLEHLSVADYAHLGKVIHRCIGDSGRGLLHFIGRSYKGVFSRWIRKRIFPGAYAPTLGEAMTVLQPYQYDVLDVENLRPHYARTLEHWLARFEKAAPRVVEMYDPWFQRAWLLYLAGSIAAFRTGTLQLFQIVFAGPKSRPGSWTRAPLYAEPAADTEDGKWIHAMS
jgi:cyclopropane-fatty-acyl-phospholipid synthase